MLLFQLISAALFASVEASSLDGCTQFSTNGTVPHQFSYYRFYDFRNLVPTTTLGLSTRDQKSPSKVVTDGSWVDDWQRRVQYREAPDSTTIPMYYMAENVMMISKLSLKTLHLCFHYRV